MKRTDTTANAFRLVHPARALAASTLITIFVSLAMGATSTPSTARLQSQPVPGAAAAPAAPATPPRRAPVVDTTSFRHQVVKGENLYRIALAYGVTVPDLCRANGIKDEGVVTEGQVLFVPISYPAPRAASAPTTVPRATSVSTTAPRGTSASTIPAARAASVPTSAPRAASTTPSPARSSSASGTMKVTLTGPNGPQLIRTARRTVITNQDEGVREGPDAETEEIPQGEGSPKGISFSMIPSEEPFSWPVQGGIVVSPFGMRHGRQHAGIDICAPSGSPIYAARDGVVAYSGHKFRGYGNVVMIDHGDGFSTVYAHNTANLVQEGDVVVRGQIIARVGATGNATGAHCHFEVRNDNLSVDPRGYLSESPEEDVIFAGGLPPPAWQGPRKTALKEPDLIP